MQRAMHVHRLHCSVVLLVYVGFGRDKVVEVLQMMVVDI